jgi:cysteine-rich repeat protein
MKKYLFAVALGLLLFPLSAYAAICGDGIVDGVEECDTYGTPMGSPSTCPAGWTCNMNCQCVSPPVIPACGDGIINGAEQCDVASTIAGKGCLSGQSCTNCKCVNHYQYAPNNNIQKMKIRRKPVIQPQ